MRRTVAPEILDTLPAHDAAARHSRRDLRRINACLRNAAWFRRELARRLRPDDRVLELGAGEASLHRVAPLPVPWDAVDLAPPPPGWPADARWFEADVRTFDRWRDYTVMVANLFLHHLDAAGLAAIGAALQPHARLILASEPARTRGARLGFALLCPLIGAHAVTRHDGRVSIAAGFRGDELAPALALDDRAWSWQGHDSWLGANRFVAQRTAP